MKIKDFFKLKRSFFFKKTELNIEGTNFWNMRYETITDGTVISRLKRLSKEHKVEIVGIDTNRLCGSFRVTIYSHKSDFINFVLDFASELQKYIEDVQF